MDGDTTGTRRTLPRSHPKCILMLGKISPVLLSFVNSRYSRSPPAPPREGGNDNAMSQLSAPSRQQRSSSMRCCVICCASARRGNDVIVRCFAGEGGEGGGNIDCTRDFSSPRRGASLREFRPRERVGSCRPRLRARAPIAEVMSNDTL